MQRITITVDDDLLTAIDDVVARRSYPSRSEAVRDLVRDTLAVQTLAAPKAVCVAALAYVYDHHTRELPMRLTKAQHHHHDLTVSTLHVHLNHDMCMEVSVLRGQRTDVQAFADEVSTQRGVEHAHLHMIPTGGR